MSEILIVFGFPPHPSGVALIVLCSLVWGFRSRFKNRPYLLGLQAAIVAGLVARLAIALQAGTFSPTRLLTDIAQLSIGQLVMFWFFCWLIIKLIFIIRGRNDSANIFTRNRNS